MATAHTSDSCPPDCGPMTVTDRSLKHMPWLPAGLQQADYILLNDRAAAVTLSLRPIAASLCDVEHTESMRNAAHRFSSRCYAGSSPDRCHCAEELWNSARPCCTR